MDANLKLVRDKKKKTASSVDKIGNTAAFISYSFHENYLLVIHSKTKKRKLKIQSLGKTKRIGKSESHELSNFILYNMCIYKINRMSQLQNVSNGFLLHAITINIKCIFMLAYYFHSIVSLSESAE